MIGNDWDDILKEEFSGDSFRELSEFLRKERETFSVFPSEEFMYRAFSLSSYAETKMVILGQDPYHEKGQAHGLCFSVPAGVRIPPSLRNIYKELHEDLGTDVPGSGDLSKLAEQGVLLLNTVLTVREGEAGSHKKRGWEAFTDAVIRKLDEREKPCVFLLWGNPAKEKKKFLTNPSHLVLTGSHPSPLGAYQGFFGGKYFSRANEFLKANGMTPIDYSVLS